MWRLRGAKRRRFCVGHSPPASRSVPLLAPPRSGPPISSQRRRTGAAASYTFLPPSAQVAWVRCGWRVWAGPSPSQALGAPQRLAARPKARRRKPPGEMVTAPGRSPPPRPLRKRSAPFESVGTGASTQPKRYAVDRGGRTTDGKVPPAAKGRGGSPTRGQALRVAPNGQCAAADASPPTASPRPSGPSPSMAGYKSDAAPHPRRTRSGKRPRCTRRRLPATPPSWESLFKPAPMWTRPTRRAPRHCTRQPPRGMWPQWRRC